MLVKKKKKMIKHAFMCIKSIEFENFCILICNQFPEAVLRERDGVLASTWEAGTVVGEDLRTLLSMHNS